MMTDEMPIHEKSVVFQLSGTEEVQVLRDIVYKTSDDEELAMDIYLPPVLNRSAPRPGVVFIHGGPISPDYRPKIKDWGQYKSYGKLMALAGLVGITFNHRYHSLTQIHEAAADILDVLAFIREQGETWGLDATRLCLWAFSGGGLLISPFLRHLPDNVRCIVTYYALLDPTQMDDASEELSADELREFSSVEALNDASIKDLPIFLARAGNDYPGFKRSNDDFIQAAHDGEVALEVMNHPNGQHAFDLLDDDARSRKIIARTIEFVNSNLLESAIQ